MPSSPTAKKTCLKANACLAAFAGYAEAIGLDSVWVCDHFVSCPPRPAFRGHPRGLDAALPRATDEAILAGSVVELARAIDAHEALGTDDLIVQVEPKTERRSTASPTHYGRETAEPDSAEPRRVRSSSISFGYSSRSRPRMLGASGESVYGPGIRSTPALLGR